MDLCIFEYPVSHYISGGDHPNRKQQRSRLFLGQTTRYAYFYFPALLFCYLGDEYEFGKISPNTVCLYIICLITLIQGWAVGSLIALLLFIPFVLLGKKKIFNSIVYFILQVSSFIGLTFFSIQNLLAGFIINYLHKDITMSSRTIIWNRAFEALKNKPVFGIGILSNDNMHDLFGFVHVHNHLLQVLLQCGYVGLVLFLLILLGSYIRLHKNRDYFPAKVLAFFIFTVGIQLLVDTVDGVRNHYLFMITMGAAFPLIRQQLAENHGEYEQ